METSLESWAVKRSALNAPWNFVLQDRWFNLRSRWGSTVKCYRKLQFVADQEDKKAGQLLWAGKCIDAELQEGCQTTIWLADMSSSEF